MSSARLVAKDFTEMAVETRAKVHAVTVFHGALLQAAVKRHAAQPRTNPRPRTGEPEGPRLLTGSYNRSITRRTTKTLAESNAAVGTSDIRGRALEFGNPNGFGQGINILPYPHFGPALDEVRPKYEAALAVAILPARLKSMTSVISTSTGESFT